MRPRPALQCTATPPGSLSTMSRKRSTMSELGQEPSTKNRSKCRKPPFVNADGLYSCADRNAQVQQGIDRSACKSVPLGPTVCAQRPQQHVLHHMCRHQHKSIRTFTTTVQHRRRGRSGMPTGDRVDEKAAHLIVEPHDGRHAGVGKVLVVVLRRERPVAPEVLCHGGGAGEGKQLAGDHPIEIAVLDLDVGSTEDRFSGSVRVGAQGLHAATPRSGRGQDSTGREAQRSTMSRHQPRALPAHSGGTLLRQMRPGCAASPRSLQPWRAPSPAATSLCPTSRTQH